MSSSYWDPHNRYWDDRDIEGEAKWLLNVYTGYAGVSAKAPVDIEGIVRYCGFEIVYDITDRAVSGKIDIKKKQIILNVLLKEPHKLHERRFRIASLLGHSIVHVDEMENDEPDMFLYKKICITHRKTSQKYKDKLRKQADRFGPSLLMEREMVCDAIEEEYGTRYLPFWKLVEGYQHQYELAFLSPEHISDIERALRPISDRFKVSAWAFRRRVEELDLFDYGQLQLEHMQLAI